METIENPKPQVSVSEQKTNKIRLWFLSALLLVAILAVVFAANLAPNLPAVLDAKVKQTSGDYDGRLANLEGRLKQTEDKLATILPGLIGGQANAPSSGASPDVSDLDNLKLGLAGLSAALTTLQQELEKSAKTTNENRINAQVGLSTILGFIEMQRVALSGQPFEKERQGLRKIAEGDQTLVDLLVKIEPQALSGAATLTALYKEWKAVAVQARTAMRKAAAQTWTDRVAVALEGLVSIKSLTPKKVGESLSFSAIDLDLEQNNLPAAVEKAAALPPDVQESIQGWRAKAEGRLLLEKTLSEIFDHLMIRGAQSEVGVPVEPTPQQGETH